MSARVLPAVHASVGGMRWETLDARRLMDEPAEESAAEILPDVTPAASGPDWEGQCREWERRYGALQGEADTRERSALQAGAAQARAAADQEWRAKLAEQEGRVTAALAHVSGLAGRLRAQAEGDVVRLAMAISRRILHREVSMDPEALTSLVQVALARVGRQDRVRARCAPDWAGRMRKGLESQAHGARVEVVEDATLPAGGLLLETAQGEVDVSLETQLSEVERGFTDLLRRRTA